jgi:L-lactate utilization protein LutB
MNRLQQIARQREETLKAYPALEGELTSIRKETINNLTELMQKAQENLQAKGCKVYFTNTAKEAQELLGEILKGQEQVVRTYSNTLKEIELDTFLAKRNIKVNKSNIGEIIAAEIKVAGQGHPVIPALGLREEQIVKGLQSYLAASENWNPQELNRLIHQKIKAAIVKSEFGITGLNSIIAQNGTIILAEDEGNARAVSNLPYRHIAVAGIEKIYETAEKAMTTLQGAAIYGLGKKVPTYFSLISGPSRTADIEFRMAYGMHGPKEVYVILLDNGRRELIKQGKGEFLQCVDCGACFEECAKLAKTNKWTEITLTPKAIALGIVQGRISKPKDDMPVNSFPCPVGIKGETMVQNLLSIKSLV